MRAIATSTALGSLPGISGKGTWCSTTALTSEMWRRESPCTRGMCSFTSTMRRLAPRAAVEMKSFDVPKVKKPARSIGETVVMTTSTSMASAMRRGS